MPFGIPTNPEEVLNQLTKDRSRSKMVIIVLLVLVIYFIYKLVNTISTKQPLLARWYSPLIWPKYIPLVGAWLPWGCDYNCIWNPTESCEVKGDEGQGLGFLQACAKPAETFYNR